MAMWCVAIKLPAALEPEWITTHTWSFSFRQTSRKWFPGAEGAQLPSRPLGQPRPDGIQVDGRRVSVEERPCCGPDLAVGPSHSRGHRPAKLAYQRLKVIGKVALDPVGDHGDHPAADVHTDRGGQYRVFRRNDAPHGRSYAQMSVRHKSDVAVENGTGCEGMSLLTGHVIEDAGPDPYISFLVHACRFLGTVVARTWWAAPTRRRRAPTRMLKTPCDDPADPHPGQDGGRNCICPSVSRQRVCHGLTAPLHTHYDQITGAATGDEVGGLTRWRIEQAALGSSSRQGAGTWRSGPLPRPLV